MFGPFHDLAKAWRDEADLYRRRGQERLAEMAESYAADLEEVYRRWELGELTLEEYAEQMGRSYSTAQKKVASGEIPNIGRKHRPRVSRGDALEEALSRRRQAG